LQVVVHGPELQSAPAGLSPARNFPAFQRPPERDRTGFSAANGGNRMSAESDKDKKRERWGALVDAAVDDPAKARRMVAEDPSVLKETGLFDETALHYLAVENFVEGVRLLLELGADPNAQSDSGDTPLHDCLTLGNNELVDILLEAGANPNIFNECEETPMYRVAERGDVEMLEKLKAFGGRMDIPDSFGLTLAGELEFWREWEAEEKSEGNE
jgi:hypothetical protein